MDVIIVGAGVAGLAAGARVRAAGLSPLLIEAAGRVGGRALTTTPAVLHGATFDHGASWLHAAERNPLAPIARARGVRLTDTSQIASSRTYVDGHPASAEELAAYDQAERRFRAVMERALALDADPSVGAVADAARGDDPWITTVETWEAPIIAAADAHALSLRDWHLNRLEGSNLVVEGGLGAFVARHLASDAGEVRLGTAAKRIAWGRGVTVETEAGTLTAPAAIVTVSTGVLASGSIDFVPALPADVAAALHALPMGLLSKVALPAAGPDRLGLPVSCALDHRIGRPGEPAMFFVAWPSAAPYVVGFIGGTPAWELEHAGPAAREDFARAELRRLLGGDVGRALGPGAVVTDWGGNPLFRGAYAYALPGCAAARRRLATPLGGGTLVFAGEATRSDGLAGTVGGAYLSGVEAAEAVLARLGTG